MKLKDIDIYNLPRWLNGICEEMEGKCCEELKKESDFYNRVLEESSQLLEEYRFISTLIDRGDIIQPMKLNVSEEKALSRFLVLDSDQRDMEMIQFYLFGIRHALQLLQVLKIT